MSQLKITMAAFLLFGLFFAGCTEALYNVKNSPVPKPGGQSLSLDDVKKAIMRSSGTNYVHYQMHDVEPGLIRCELNFKNKHRAWVDIRYSKDSYSILYQSSTNLRYEPASDEGGETIHRHYNTWIRDLDQSIQNNLRIVRAKNK